MEKEDQLKELTRQVRRLTRENGRMQAELTMLKGLNEQVTSTQKYIQKENRRQICYNNQLLKTFPYVLIMVDEQLHTVMASEAFFRLSGMNHDQVKEGLTLQQALSCLLMNEQIGPFVDKCKDALNKSLSLSSHEEEVDGEGNMLTSTILGEEKILQYDISYYQEPNDNVRGLSIIFSDMTEIMEAKERAVNADKAKSNFLANMSHEIRTPMNAITGMAEFILRDSLDEEAKGHAAMIRSAANSLIAIINDILDFSKIESGKMEIIEDRYSLSSLICDVATMIRIRLGEKDVKLVVSIDPDIPDALYGDEVRIKQVLINILNNAVKFTEHGQIRLTVGYKKIEEDTCCLQFAVADTGMGIKKEELAKIFDSFTQVDTKKNRSKEGTGLGLAISRKLVTMMGGDLSVQSEYGKGTEFSFDMISRVIDWAGVGDLSEATKNTKADVFVNAFTAPGARILVVDDNEMNLKVASGILKPYGIQPVCTESGKSALKLLEHHTYDLIFMDHMMPQMDGVETMERIRSMEGGADQKIIVLTANALRGIETSYVEAGFDGYLAKPIRQEEMAEVLYKMLPKELIREGEPTEDEVDERAYLTEEEVEAQGRLEVLKRHGINVECGLQYAMDNEDFYLEIVDDFASSWKDKKEMIAGYYDEEDWNDYRIAVHAMKSTAKTIGADDLSDLAKELESAARNQDMDFIRGHHKNFIALGSQTVRLLSQSGNL